MDSRQSRCLLSGVGLHSLLVYSISHTLSSEKCTSAKLFSARWQDSVWAVVEVVGGAGSGKGGAGLALRALQLTPAMAAGVTNHLWTIKEMLNEGTML